MELIFGAGKLDRRVTEEPTTPRDRVLVEDLAVTMLINSRVDARQAVGVFRNGPTLDLSVLPDKALAETTDSEREVVAEVVAAMTTWPGIGASVATKTLHKKRPALIPILDNLAIFGAYMYPLWPEKRARAETIKAVPRIKEALDWIAEDLTRPENACVWPQLQAIEPKRSQIDLFDMIWWMYFRKVEPVVAAPSS
jgi:hypothetical protein